MKWNCVIAWVLIALVLCSCAKPAPPAPVPVPPPDTTPPPPITGLVASDADNGKVLLSWEPSPAGDFDHYNVYLSQVEITSVADMTPVRQITNITANSCRLTGLDDGTRYYFAVTAVDDSGNESSVVAVASAIPAVSDTTPPETAIISAPSETIDYSNVSFQWTGSDDITATADLVYSYKLEGHDAEYSPFTPDTGKTYINLPDGTYVFHVRARDEAGNIDPTPATSQFAIATAAPTGPLTLELPILRNSEVNRIAVGADGESVYALDSVNTRLYKSSYSGYGWVDISAGLTGATTWDELAIAPDTPEVVAVVTGARSEVCLSTNGGGAFFSLGLAANLAGGELIQCIAISPGYGESARELAVGTSTGNGGGRVWVYKIPFSGWLDVSSGAAGWLPTVPAIGGTDVFAIKYSPAFAGDRAILAIVSSSPAPDTDDTYLYIGKRVGGTMTWNGNVVPGYPVEICRSGEDTPGSPLTYADLALPSDYFALDGSSRCVYAGWSDNPRGTAVAGNSNDDVYRVDDTRCNRLSVGGGSEYVISSLAYYGTCSEGKLLAGAMRGAASGVPATPIYFTFNPQSSSPTWKSSVKPPTGPNEAQVAWSPDGSTAYCGTSTIGGASGDQSAFSVSPNDGLSWNQTGLIDT